MSDVTFELANADDARAYINEPRWQKVELGLNRMACLLSVLGNPQDSYKCVHVAGTNGKGSVSSFIAKSLEASGLRTGLFMSPYVYDFSERIQVNSTQIDDVSLLEITRRVKDAACKVEEIRGDHPTEFELMFAVGACFFEYAKCDIVVIEVGLGGRLDATNVITPAISVICRIGLDHTSILGNTIESIAFEKAGIIKQGVPCISWPQEPGAMRVIEEKCKSLGSSLCVTDFSKLEIFGITETQFPTCLLRKFAYRGNFYMTQMLGHSQPKNAAVAIDVLHMLQRVFPCIDEDAIKQGIYKSKLPARIEIISRNPFVVIDGSHNPQGVCELKYTLIDMSLDKAHITAVMGVMADKDYEAMISEMAPIVDRFVVFTAPNPRALSADALADTIRKIASDKEVIECRTPKEAIEFALNNAYDVDTGHGAVQVVVVFGSLYSAGSIRSAILM